MHIFTKASCSGEALKPAWRDSMGAHGELYSIHQHHWNISGIGASVELATINFQSLLQHQFKMKWNTSKRRKGN